MSVSRLRVFEDDRPPLRDEPQDFARLPEAALASAELSDNAKVVLAGCLAGVYSLAQASYATVEEIARACGKRERQAQRGLRELERARLIARERDRTKGGAPWRTVFLFRLKGPRGVPKTAPPGVSNLTPPEVSKTTPWGVKDDTPGCQKRHLKVSDLTPPSERGGEREKRPRPPAAARPHGGGPEPRAAGSEESEALPSPEAPPSPEELASWRRWARGHDGFAGLAAQLLKDWEDRGLIPTGGPDEETAAGISPETPRRPHE